MRHSHTTWPRTHRDDAPIVIAHRGASATQRESSIAAFEAAIAAGAQAIETDARLTRDGVLVCCHDPDLLRIAGDARRVSDLEWTELQTATDGQSVALGDAIVRIGGRCSVLIDLKLDRPDDLAAFVEQVRPLRQLSDIAIGARSLEVASLMRAELPGVPMVGLFKQPDLLEPLAALGDTWWRLWQADLTAARVDAARQAGVPLLVMVGGHSTDVKVGDIARAELERVLAMGVDGVMVNDPAQALAAIEQGFPRP